jgi:hypothetical protein
MPVLQCPQRLPIEHHPQAIRPRERRPGLPRHGAPDRGLVIVAHVASLLSVGAIVTGLTFGSIAVARRSVGAIAASGLAATAPEDGGRSRAGTTEAETGLSR